MSESEEKITNLEELVLELQLETHAAKVAIAVLSTALNSVMGKETNLGEMYLTGIARAKPVELNHPAPDGYREKLDERVAALLGKSK
ncbi:MAG: hypothetical protein EOO84_10965 [Pantoea sp.]|uniref:hypothetical protein n=1 Tax=Pantoea sp. TaxID=69393 RepID=UPI0012262FAE|nr:hypothetical protein [Pantoea sp.]RZK07203.1 MAG: hypothetical protein EOO84_10965 [Pantoea sp.]